MAQLTSLPQLLLVKIAHYLGLKDLLALGDVNRQLQEAIYNSSGPTVWTSQLLFPVGDQSITDKFIERFVPRITRSYDVQELRLIGLPLSWTGLLFIFDQFAHSVDSINLATTDATLSELVRHLSIFAGTLALLQYENRIPITFRQYALDDAEYSQALEASDYLGRHTLSSLHRSLSLLKLDDPPFERLVHLSVSSTDHTPLSDENPLISQIHFLAAFLAGRPLSPPSPRSSKRPLDASHIFDSSATKHRRHDILSL